MENIKRRVFWTFMILLSCTPSQSTSPCNVQLKTICLPSQDIVEVPCPNVTGREMTFHLYKDQEILSNVTCSRENDAILKCKSQQTEAGMDLREQRNLVSFFLTGLTDSRRGIYRCEGTVMFPPPLIYLPSVLMIQVLEEHLCKCNKDSSNHGDDPSRTWMNGHGWIWILVVALLSIYSISVTIVAVVNWVKLRNSDYSDYMNTKPRASRDRKKKRGVQKPIPRHF